MAEKHYPVDPKSIASLPNWSPLLIEPSYGGTTSACYKYDFNGGMVRRVDSMRPQVTPRELSHIAFALINGMPEMN